ncbi:hypothetical protein VTN49DRAFT_510 [Thermomyces lanuginosus]|uniref:uncharacterized protein n=1 Tax=Thermomyces lanuginosus TaxID=5541 RepID=UPI003744A589
MSSHPPSKKRRLESYNVDVKLVEIYEDLANEKDDVRLKAAQELVSRFTPESSPTEEQIQKALRRLFRGLCSGRKAARVGFSIALTEVLAQVFSVPRPDGSEVTVPKVLDILESTTDAGGSESGQEHRDHHFGRLFGAEAIIKSSILFKPDVTLEEWKRLVALVVQLGKKKPWLREECGWILYRGIFDLASQKDDVKYAEALIEEIRAQDLIKTPEGVALWLAVKDAFPGAALPENIWKHNDPLDSREKHVLTKVMKESSSADEDSQNGVAKNQTGVWNPKVHFAWDAILSRISEPSSRDKSKEKTKSSRLSFSDFWTEIVDNGLFAAASSEERKFWGFSLFNKVLNELPSHLASQTFSKNLVRCLTNQLAVEDRYLHRMAVKTAKTIHNRVSKEPEFATAAVNGLLGPSGSVIFDQVTKTKTVEKIITEASPAALGDIISLIDRLMARPGTGEAPPAASHRQSLANLLIAAVRARSSAGTEYRPMMEMILSTLVRYAYSTGEADKAQEPPVSTATQEYLRTRINTCLNSLVANSENPAGMVYRAVRQIRDAQKSGTFVVKMDDAITESLEKGFKSLKKLSSKVKHEGDKVEPSVRAFQLLYSMTLLQVYNGDGDAVTMLDELEFCYSKFWGKKSKEDTSDASNALVEILLSFASKPSQLFRRMSEQIFSVFAGQITADGLQSLIDVLEAKENLSGQQEMFQREDEDDDEDEEMSDADDLDSDVEVVDASDEEKSGSGSEDENEEELAAFDAKLAEALGTRRADEDLAANDSSSDSGEEMNDEQMEAVDDMLARVFKARKQALNKKRDKKDARETMVNFKNRVLDLLEIYVKKCTSSVLALDLLLPLLRLTRTSTVKQLSQKAGNVLREYTRLCKGNALPKLSSDADGEDQVKAAWELLRAIHKEAMLSGPAAHAASASQASLLLVKVLVAHDKKNISAVVDLYAETRKTQLLSNKCHVQPTFFTDWNNWCVNASKTLRE